ncbi:glycosyltransferase [Anaerococcus porci]|uniref:glycosyltransferase n=1 Tax=Anaerococcus porci TaxID=2652269 RepID=UPI002A7597B6|nr:glycosyltransferase [Anaerococcus porci]MDY3006751.1 glycosyltransferase [Anaerococcus porci]
MIKLSVIVAIYNVEKYLEKCIESLLNQNCSEYELILVDDGSKDNSSKICNHYLNKENIKVIHQENLGVSVARNTGIKNSSGEWITFVDGDDFVENNFISEIMRIIKNIDTEMIMFNYNAFFDEKKIIACRSVPFTNNQFINKSKELIQKRMISQYYNGGDKNTIVSSGTTWCKVIKRDILQNNNIRFKPGLIKAQDTVFWLQASENVSSIYYLDKCIYNYRLSNNSISSGKRYIKDSVQKFNDLLFEYKRHIIENKKNDDYNKAFNLRCIQVLMWNVDHNFFNKKNKNSLKIKLNQFKEVLKQDNYKIAINNVEGEYLPLRLKLLLRYIRSENLIMYYMLYNIHNFLSNIKNGRK